MPKKTDPKICWAFGCNEKIAAHLDLMVQDEKTRFTLKVRSCTEHFRKAFYKEATDMVDRFVGREPNNGDWRDQPASIRGGLGT